MGNKCSQTEDREQVSSETSSNESGSADSMSNRSETEEAENNVLTPYGKPIAERPGNIQGREQWFRHRSGSRR